MKKIIFFVAVLGALIVGLTSNVKAQTVDFWCIITISDTCNGGGYNGYYDITMKLDYGTSPQCTAVGSMRGSGPSCVKFTCSLIPNYAAPNYKETITKVQRSDGTCAASFNLYQGGLWWNDISTCNSNTPQFTINL